MKAMNEWCKYLSEKNRSTLTRKIFLRRATYEAFKLNFDMGKLPNTWIRTILDAHEMILYKKKKNYAKYGMDDKLRDPSSDSDVEWKVKTKKKKSPGPPRKKGRPSLGSKRSSVSASTSTPTSMAAKEEPKPTPQPQASIGKDSNGNPYKKFVDLSNEPPPGWWLQAYAQGSGPKRELRVFSTEDQNIIFYDYTQDEETEDSVKCVRRPHDRDNVNVNFDWWAKYTKEKEARRAGGGRGRGAVAETATKPDGES